MVTDLAKFAKDKGVKYFMISYTDLFGGQRAKLVPAQAIAEMSVDGCGVTSESAGRAIRLCNNSFLVGCCDGRGSVA